MAAETSLSTAGKIWGLLTSAERRSAVVLHGLMFVGMVLETLGIGLVIPAMVLMTQGDLVAKYPVLAPWLNRLGNPSHERLVIAGMLILVGVYAVKDLFLGFLAWRQARFVHEFNANLSQRLFAGYLRQPYAFHLQRNSAQLIRNTIGQAGGLADAIYQGLILITEMLVLLSLAILLITVEPQGALLVMSVFGLAGWGFHRITRSRILRWGEARQHHEGMRIQHLQQGLGGAKEVRLLGRESDFLAQYWMHNSGSARVGQRQVTLQALPRLLLELLAVCGLAALVFVMVARGKPLETLLPTLGVFAAAAFRVMPSVNRVLAALQTVRYALPVIDVLRSEIRLLDATTIPPRGRPVSFQNVLTLDQVSFQYQNAHIQALRSVSLSIPRGASVGFIGGSGAGKSTLVDIMLGLLTPVSGTVKVDGIDIQTNMRGWQDQIGYVPQSIFLTDDTLRRNVAFGLSADQIDEVAVWRAIRAAQLEQFVHDLPQGLDTMVGERGIRLSGGQRQRIGIARALYLDPPVLVLDEATSSLDIATERGFMEAIRSLHGKKTLLIVAHRLSTVEHCDRLFRLEQGKVLEEKGAAVVGANAEQHG
ncbi:MAG: ABC transporter ATP-binding protein [Nitrospirota bacterium]